MTCRMLLLLVGPDLKSPKLSTRTPPILQSSFSSLALYNSSVMLVIRIFVLSALFVQLAISAYGLVKPLTLSRTAR